MKNLVLCLVAFAVMSGCATKSDIQSANSALEQRLEAVEVSEACHGKTLELFLFSMEIRAAMANVTSKEQADEVTQAQLSLMILQQDQQTACRRLQALKKSQENK